MSSDSKPNSNVLPVLLCLAVLGLVGWNAWLTVENNKMKQAVANAGTGNASELADKVEALEQSLENGLVLSIINPSRGSTELSYPVQVVSTSSAAASTVIPALSSNSAEDEDPNAAFDFSTGSNEDGPDSANVGAIENGPTEDFFGPKPESARSSESFGPSPFPGEMVNPDEGPTNLDSGKDDPNDLSNLGPVSETVSSREPGPSTGTFGESRPLVDGSSENYLYELSVESLLNNTFVSLDGGSTSGVKVGAFFAVLRKNKEIGQIQVQEVRERTSIAEITEYVGGITIRQGDRLVPIRK